MSKPERQCALRRGVPATVPIVLCIAMLNACGLGMSTEETFARAEQAFKSGDTRAAIIDAKNILLDNPDHVQARLLLGRASLANGDAVSAEKELRWAVDLGVPFHDIAVDLASALLQQRKFQAVVDEIDVSLATDDADRRTLQRVLADAHLSLGRPDLARDLYSSVLATDPNDRAAQLGVVHSYIAEQNPLQARATLTQILEFDDSYAPAWLTSARLRLVAGELEAATREFDRAGQLATESGDLPLRIEALFGIAETSVARGEMDEARKYSAQLDEIAPGHMAALQIAARIAYADADWTTAEGKLADILRRMPDNNRAKMLLGAVHLQSGNLGQAEMYLSAAVAGEPGNADARRLLAETRLQLNKSNEAEQALQPLLDDANVDPRSLAMAARISMLSGDFDSATAYLERSAGENPGDADVQLDLAVAYLLAGRMEKAQAALDAAPVDESEDSAFRRDALRVLSKSRFEGQETALAAGAALREKWPRNAMAHVLHGAMLFASGDFERSREAFNAAHALVPDNINVRRYLAQVDEAEGKTAEAAGRYRALLDERRDDAQAMFALARIAALNEHPGEAIDWLEQAAKADTTAVAPRAALSKLYIAANRFDAAEKVALEAIALNDTIADVHNTLGVARLRMAHAAAALESFERAVELDPENTDYRLNLARAYAAGGDEERALTVLEAEGDGGLEHLRTAVMLANIRARSGDLQGALEIAAKLRRIHPGSAAPIALEAELRGRNGELDKAVSLYDEALKVEVTKAFAVRAHHFRQLADLPSADEPLIRFLELRPLDIDARQLLAQYYHQHGEMPRAISEYRRVLEIDPEDFAAINNLAWLYFATGDARAEATARQAHALAPRNASVLDTLGWILVRKDALEEGVELLRAATALVDSPEIRFHLAAGLAAAGNSAEAREILQEIVADDSQFASKEEARTLLGKL